MDCKDFVILILSYGRPEFLKTHTWNVLDKVNSKARRVVVMSDDDKTIPEYKKMYGDDAVFVFNKIESEKKYDIDLIDCYWGKSLSRKATVWARNEQFRIARELGYRWFMVLDDDYREIVMRHKMYRTSDGNEFFPTFKELLFAPCDEHGSLFDKCCVKYFNILNSAPWLYSTAFSQCGDFIGGCQSILVRKYPWRWKAMNVFFCDTEKEYRYYGRFNDDVNAYVLNGRRGQMSLTLPVPSINQEPTQKTQGGVTDLYKMFGTYVKSLTSAVVSPSSVSVSCMGTVAPRIHHLVEWIIMCPRVVDESLCKEKPLDYKTECLHSVSFTPDPNRIVSFMDPLCEVVEDGVVSHSSIDSFF